MMAPAVHACETPKASPTPSNATPMVAMVVHELPESNDTSEKMMQAVTKKNRGDRICTP